MLLEQKKRGIEKMIVEQSSEMMDVFLHSGAKKKPSAQWKDQFKKQVMLLLWECYFEEIPPPIELVMLSSCILGKRHDRSTAQFAVVSYLASTCPPAKAVKDLPPGVKTEVSRIIKQHGGLQKKPRQLDSFLGNEEHDYRRIFDKWIKDEIFIRLWQKKYVQYQNRPRDAEAIEIAKMELEK
ncbi:MAG: hypothetical protein ACK502_09600 [Alphaproteobacteria bacterium]